MVIPTLDVYPVTAIEIGELERVNPESLPQERFPTNEPVVAIPTVDVFEAILQVTIPVEELYAWTW